MKRFRFLSLMLVLPILIGLTGCKDSTTEPTVEVNEAEVLVSYLEGTGGDYLNSTACPSVVSAADVYTTLTTNPTKQYLIDIRAASDFTAGRIQGAVQVDLANLLTHVKGINTQSFDRVVIVCYSGQSAAFGASLLRVLGYNNVWSLKFGMCSWDSTFAVGRWLASMKNDRWAQFTQTASPKNAAGSLPKLSTGKTTGKEILEARVEALLKEGYTPASISNSTLYTSLSSYYIVNYWTVAEYNIGHVQGAVQYTPRADLKNTTFLKTLPTDKPTVVYCYTGQTSSYVSAILRLIGYDAKSLLYGANAMMYDNMTVNKFSMTEIKRYPWVK